MSSKRAVSQERSLLPAMISKTAALPRKARLGAQSIKEILAAGSDKPDVFEELTLQEHLEELRSRIVKACVAIVPAFVVGFIVAPPLLKLIRDKAQVEGGFDILTPVEPFTNTMKVALYVAIGIAAPVIFYQFIAFIAPGLTRKERRLLFTALPFVSLLFLAGSAFAFFVVVPLGLNFLSTYQSDIYHWTPRASAVVEFYQRLMLGLGLAFQLPLIMYLLSKLGLVSRQRLRRFRKYAFLLVLIASAIITPADPFTMVLAAVPLYTLYELGILMARRADPIVAERTTLLLLLGGGTCYVLRGRRTAPTGGEPLRHAL